MGSKRKQLNRALQEAVIARNVSLARELLAQGADPRSSDKEHDEAVIILAAKFADAAMVRMLLEAGAEVDVRDDQGRTALFSAPVLSDVFLVLLEAGADIHAQDHSGETILMKHVSRSAALPEIEKLLQWGIDPGVRNEDGTWC